MTIRKFESYLDKYYEEVDATEFFNFIPIEMSSKEIERIMNKCSLPLVYKTGWDGDRQIHYDFLTHEKKNTDWVSGQVIKLVRTDVYKAEDEYYYVKITNYDWDRQIDLSTSYRCDQIEGLIQMFKDKKIYKS